MNSTKSKIIATGARNGQQNSTDLSIVWGPAPSNSQRLVSRLTDLTDNVYHTILRMCMALLYYKHMWPLLLAEVDMNSINNNNNDNDHK